MVTITLKFSDADFVRIAHSLGVAQQLVTTDKPPIARDATQSEVTAWSSGRLQQLVIDVEGAAAMKSVQPVVPPVAL